MLLFYADHGWKETKKGGHGTMPPPKYAAKLSPLNQNFCLWLIDSWDQKFLLIKNFY